MESVSIVGLESFPTLTVMLKNEQNINFLTKSYSFKKFLDCTKVLNN